MTKDHRSDLAKARDAWFESDEGQRCNDPYTLTGAGDYAKYLKNRLERALLAGVKIGERMKQNETTS